MITNSILLLATYLGFWSLVITAISFLAAKAGKSLPVRHAILVTGLVACLAAPLATTAGWLGNWGQLPAIGFFDADNTATVAHLAPTFADMNGGVSSIRSSIGKDDRFNTGPGVSSNSNAPDALELIPSGTPESLLGPKSLADSTILDRSSAISDLESNGLPITPKPYFAILRTAGIGFVLLWIIGIAFSVVISARRWLCAKRLVDACEEVDDARLTTLVSECARQLRMSHTPKLLQSSTLAFPAVTGFVNPKLIVPASFLKTGSESELKMILSHELAHIWRQDHRCVMLQTVVTCFYWWNPFVHTISSELSRVRELICDDIAVASCGRWEEYARSIVAIAETVTRFPHKTLQLGMSAGNLEQRIVRLIANKGEIGASSISRGWKSALVAITMICVSSIAVAQVSVPSTAHNIESAAFDSSEQETKTIVSSGVDYTQLFLTKPLEIGVNEHGGVTIVGQLKDQAGVAKEDQITIQEIIPNLKERIDDSNISDISISADIVIRALGTDKLEVIIAGVEMDEAKSIWKRLTSDVEELTSVDDQELTAVDQNVMKHLTGVKETPNIVFHYRPEDLDSEELAEVVKLNLNRFDECKKLLQMEFKGQAHIFLYRDVNDLQKTTGVGAVAFATGTVSIHQAVDFNSVHELTHIFAMQFPSNEDAVTDGFACEGLATILAKFDEEIPIHTWAAVYQSKSRLPNLIDLRRSWPGGAADGVHPYHVAGSFVGYLIQEFGIEKVKRWYVQSTEAHMEFGKPFRRLERDWLAWLKEQTVQPEHQKHILAKLGVIPERYSSAKADKVFDGESLAGLQTDDEANWKAENGILIGRDDNSWTTVFSQREFPVNVGVRVKFRLVEGKAVSIQVNRNNDNGNHVNLATWATYMSWQSGGYLPIESLKLKPGEWNEVVLVNDNGTGRLYVNGLVIAEHQNAFDLEKGSLGIGVEEGTIEVEEFVTFTPASE